MTNFPNSQATVEYLREAREYLDKHDLSEIPIRVKELVKEHDKWRVDSCINMIASENILSPTAKALMGTDFAGRVAEGYVGNKMYKGHRYTDQIEAFVVEQAKRLYNVRYVDYRPTSGATTNAVAFNAFTNPGDVVASLTIPAGAHISYRRFGVAGFHGLKVVDIPFDTDNYEFDLDALEHVVKSNLPKQVIIGASVMLFPYPLRRMKEIVEETGSKIMYDGAHVMGLIAGKRFQDPLKEGANVLCGSTHKTFPCGLGGLLLWNNEEYTEPIHAACYPGIVASHGPLNRLVSMAVVLAELLAFGEGYADQVVRNAKVFAKSAHEQGLNPLYESRGYTESRARRQVER